MTPTCALKLAGEHAHRFTETFSDLVRAVYYDAFQHGFNLGFDAGREREKRIQEHG